MNKNEIFEQNFLLIINYKKHFKFIFIVTTVKMIGMFGTIVINLIKLKMKNNLQF
jgi:hypothetical protein